jgi:hypothetical protein
LVEQGTFNPKVAGSIPARPIGLERNRDSQRQMAQRVRKTTKGHTARRIPRSPPVPGREGAFDEEATPNCCYTGCRFGSTRGQQLHSRNRPLRGHGRPRHAGAEPLDEFPRSARNSSQVRRPTARSGVRLAPPRNARAALPGSGTGTISRCLRRACRYPRTSEVGDPDVALILAAEPAGGGSGWGPVSRSAT